MKGLIALGGTLQNNVDLSGFAPEHDVWIAADSGFDHYRSVGLYPHHLVGDLDSVANSDFGPTAVHHLPDQDHSDADKALALAIQLGLESVTLICGQGPRVDHLFGIFSSIARSPINARVIFSDEVAFSLRKAQTLCLPTDAHEVLSVIPMPEARVTLHGVLWPLDRATLRLDGAISLSNRASEDQVTLWCESGFGAAFLPATPRRFSADVWSH